MGSGVGMRVGAASVTSQPDLPHHLAKFGRRLGLRLELGLGNERGRKRGFGLRAANVTLADVTTM